VFEEQSAGDRAECDAEAGRGGPDGDRDRTFAAVGEHVDEDRQRRREQQGRADTHRTAPRDQLSRSRRTGGEDGAETEQHQSRLQHALAAEAVAERAGRHEQPGEHQDVGVDDPLELAGGRTELAHEGRERDVDDRAVEHDREHGEAEHAEDAPSVWVEVVARTAGDG